MVYANNKTKVETNARTRQITHPKISKGQHVGILPPLVSKLRAVAKYSSKNCQNEQTQVFELLFFWKKTVDLQEFKFLSTKAMGKCDG